MLTYKSMMLDQFQARKPNWNLYIPNQRNYIWQFNYMCNYSYFNHRRYKNLVFHANSVKRKCIFMKKKNLSLIFCLSNFVRDKILNYIVGKKLACTSKHNSHYSCAVFLLMQVFCHMLMQWLVGPVYTKIFFMEEEKFFLFFLASE